MTGLGKLPITLRPSVSPLQSPSVRHLVAVPQSKPGTTLALAANTRDWRIRRVRLP